MMKLAILLSLIFISQSYADCQRVPIKIAVIDTGFGYHDKGHDAKLCRYGHKDFSFDKKFAQGYSTVAPLPLDIHAHGTNIVGIIDGYARKTSINYCIVVIKYYSDHQPEMINTYASLEAIEYAANIGVNYINYSGGGAQPNERERLAIKRFIDNGGKFIAAAGNDGQDLDLPQNGYYPAMEDERIIVVGNKSENGIRSKSSNYGSVVKRWEVGEDVTVYGLTMTGTSQATAVATGKIVSESYNKCDIGY